MGKNMRTLKNSNIQKLSPTIPKKWSVRPWAGLLAGCLLLAACQSSNIKSSKSHFLRPTDPPVYLNSSVGNPEYDEVSQTDSNKDAEKPEEVYTITVTEMSVRDLLFALARDAGVNIDIYPGIDGRVTLSAIDQTLPQILDRIAKQVTIRYEIKDGAIIVSPDLPFMKVYEVDYVNIMRSSKSSNMVSTQLSKTGMDSSSESEQPGSDESNLSTSNLNTATKNQFWQTLSSNIEIILNPRVAMEAKALANAAPTIEDGLTGLTPDKFDQDSILSNIPAKPVEKKSGIMALNPEAGQISIFASASQHERIQELLDAIMGSVHRQVMIESTVVEVVLSDKFQEGVDWDKMLNAASEIGLRGVFSHGEFLTLGRTSSPVSSVSSENAVRAAIKALETFGNTKVLSSPKIMALNNQPALLKVVKNEVFFTLKSAGTSSTNVSGDVTANSSITSEQQFDTKIHTVPVGLIMSVIPQISKDGIVTLNVRPTITRITSFKDDPNPSLRISNNRSDDIINKIPEIEVKEMETIMRVHSGQVAVMGGLMQDEIINTSEGMPGLGRLPGLSFLFSHKDRSVKKTELVIFLRPVIIGHDQPKSQPRRLARRSANSHLTNNTRGDAPQRLASQQPREDVAPASEPIAAPSTARMVPNQAAAGSYLDFTSPQGFNGAAPAPTQFSTRMQPRPDGIAPPPARPALMAAPAQQPNYQTAAYPGPQGQQHPVATQAAYGQNRQAGFFIDLGSYLERTHANDVQRKINAIGLPIQQESALVQGQTYQRVRSGPFPSQETANQAMVKITNYTGIQARIARF
jgi:MSHA biogenesis protein MshL